MNKPLKLMVLGCLPVAFVALLMTGCQKSSVPTVQSPIETSADFHPITEANTPTLSVATPQSSATAVDNTKHEAQVANNAKTIDPPNGLSAAASSKPSLKPKVNAEDAYQQKKPTLMGLKLAASKVAVLNRFGKPKKQFVMDEDTNDAISVYEYADFSVGFNNQNELEFVDVHSADIDPGLGGVKLGQKTEDVLAILGKPDSNTAYVLSYKAQNTILKLDMDPKEGTIQSIKLFADR